MNDGAVMSHENGCMTNPFHPLPADGQWVPADQTTVRSDGPGNIRHDGGCHRGLADASVDAWPGTNPASSRREETPSLANA
jgi:hypothetical protein